MNRLKDRRDFVRAAIVTGGALFVIAVAFTRLYVGLHWLSDVTASMLLGLSFGGMFSARPIIRRRLGDALALPVLLALYLAVAGGVRLTAPSPAMQSHRPSGAAATTVDGLTHLEPKTPTLGTSRQARKSRPGFQATGGRIVGGSRGTRSPKRWPLRSACRFPSCRSCARSSGWLG